MWRGGGFSGREGERWEGDRGGELWVGFRGGGLRGVQLNGERGRKGKERGKERSKAKHIREGGGMFEIWNNKFPSFTFSIFHRFGSMETENSPEPLLDAEVPEKHKRDEEWEEMRCFLFGCAPREEEGKGGKD